MDNHFLQLAFEICGGVAIAVILFRVVRQQYSRALSAQPRVVGGPSRMSLLGGTGVALALFGFCVLYFSPVPLDGESLLGYFALAPTIGGVLLASWVAAYYRYRVFWVPRAIDLEPREVSSGRGYVSREFLLTVIPWLTLGLLLYWIMSVLPHLDPAIYFGFFGTVAIVILIFQLTPHVLVDTQRFVLWEKVDILTLLQDFFVIVSAAWFLAAGAEWGLGDAHSREVVLIPPLFGIFCAFAAKLYDTDLHREQVPQIRKKHDNLPL
jgi:hypothetical protein